MKESTKNTIKLGGVAAFIIAFVAVPIYYFSPPINKIPPEQQAIDWAKDMGIENIKVVCHKSKERMSIAKCNLSSNNDGVIRLYSLDCASLKSGYKAGCYLSSAADDKGLL